MPCSTARTTTNMPADWSDKAVEEQNPLESVAAPAESAASAAPEEEGAAAQAELASPKSSKDPDSPKLKKRVSRKKSGEKADRKAAMYANLPPAIHRGFSCDKCGMMPIIGIRYNKKKDNYDLCETCFSKCTDEKKKKFSAKYRPEGYDPIEVKNPFMGWSGWPPLWVVIVFFIMFCVTQLAFIYLFHMFWTSGPEDETEKYFNCSHAQIVRRHRCSRCRCGVHACLRVFCAVFQKKTQEGNSEGFFSSQAESGDVSLRAGDGGQSGEAEGITAEYATEFRSLLQGSFF